MRLPILLLLVFLHSCTNLKFSSSGIIGTFVSPKEDHHHFVKKEGKKEFYLWGILPNEHVVDVDKELANMGLLSAANISVEQYTTMTDVAKAIFSFGFYVPKSYRVKGFGVSNRNDK